MIILYHVYMLVGNDISNAVIADITFSKFVEFSIIRMLLILRGYLKLTFREPINNLKNENDIHKEKNQWAAK